jgi:hypothetical protein
MAFNKMQRALTDSDTYVEDVGAAGVGFMAPYVVDNLFDRITGTDIPDEVAGLVVLALAAGYGGDYAEPMMAGAGAYTFNAAARRVGVRDTIVNVGGGV